MLEPLALLVARPDARDSSPAARLGPSRSRSLLHAHPARSHSASETWAYSQSSSTRPRAADHEIGGVQVAVTEHRGRARQRLEGGRGAARPRPGVDSAPAARPGVRGARLEPAGRRMSASRYCCDPVGRTAASGAARGSAKACTRRTSSATRAHVSAWRASSARERVSLLPARHQDAEPRFAAFDHRSDACGARDARAPGIPSRDRHRRPVRRGPRDGRHSQRIHPAVAHHAVGFVDEAAAEPLDRDGAAPGHVATRGRLDSVRHHAPARAAGCGAIRAYRSR